MIRLNTRTGAGLVALLFISVSFQSFGQSTPPGILKWEGEISVLDSLNAVEFADASTLLVTGSSSVRMWDSIHTDLAPYQVIQRGYGGSRLSDFNYYADRVIMPQQFKAIVVYIANDIHGGEEDKTPREVLGLFKVLVTKIRERNPETPVCWIEITPTPRRWQVSDQIREANRLIGTYCSKNDNLHFISTFDQFTTAEGLPDSTFFREDMLHMNRDGYIQWADLIKGSLELEGINP